ncbi:MAG: GNAT family N-acetyltransferase [Acidobacteriota bacterium]
MAELIRSIRGADLAEYRALLDECFSEGPGKEETRGALLRAVRLYSTAFPLIRVLSMIGLLPRSLPRVYICRRGERLAGAYCIRRKAPGAYYVVHVAVSSEFRRLGIASRLREYAVRRLPAEPGLRLLARHRRQNEPQIRNAAKFGFQPYLREYTMVASGEALTGFRRRLEPAAPGRLCRPRRRDIGHLRRRAIPKRVLDLDPTLAEPRNEKSRIMSLWNSLTVETWHSERALKRSGRLLGAVRVFHHRLQKTHEAEFTLDPDADETVLGFSAASPGVPSGARIPGTG